MSIKRTEYQKDTYINSQLIFKERYKNMEYRKHNLINKWLQENIVLTFRRADRLQRGKSQERGEREKMRHKRKDFSSQKNPLKMGNSLLRQKNYNKAIRKHIGKISPFSTIRWVWIFWTIHKIREKN